MKEEVLDRRVRKTRKQLRHCLASLLKEKKIQEISVREITEMADLNRGTFYLHYRDVFDLLQQIEQELLESVEAALQKYPAPEVHKDLSRLLADVFRCVEENSDMVQILLGENGDLNFVNQVKGLVREKCLKDWMELFRTPQSDIFDAYYSFIVSGCLGLVTYWLENGLKESPEGLAKIAEDIMIKGIDILTVAEPVCP